MWHKSDMQPVDICSFCGHKGAFKTICPGASLRESRCPTCGAPRRSCGLMRVLLDEAGGRDSLAALSIYELQAQGPVHDALSGFSGYISSEYLPGTPFGQNNANGVRSEDATALTFGWSSFDLVISQDVMEHIEDVWRAFAEINRVLKPGGKHIFTVPLHEGRPTRSRRGLPEVRHGDPLNPEGALVYWDFGDDLPEKLAALGIKARLALAEKFYAPEEICRVDGPEDYARYRDFMERRDKARFFLYNSNVFVAEKT